jgi:hypothetical protein
MSTRMTGIFEDDALYPALKMEVARKGRHAKDIVAEVNVIEDPDAGSSVWDTKADAIVETYCVPDK